MEPAREVQRYTEKEGVTLSEEPLFWAVAGGLSLLGLYIGILTIAESLSHAIDQLQQMWYWIAALVLGFSFQAGLYSYVRGVMKLRKQTGTATTSMAAAGGISTTSMAACCAHHITDILPILGLSAAVVFLNQYQTLFIVVGVLSNFIGISLMLKIIQKHSLYERENQPLAFLMKMDMHTVFVNVCVASAIALFVTLYMSVS